MLCFQLHKSVVGYTEICQLKFKKECALPFIIHHTYFLLGLISEPSQSVYSVTQLCLTLCEPMDCSTPGHPVHNQLLEFTQTHVHRVDNAIQLSHPLLSPSPPALNLSQHPGIFQ